MAKIRHIIVGIVSVMYLILFFMKSDVLTKVLTPVLFIILANQAIDEWINYKGTKRKIHLLIPISSLLLAIYAVSNLIYVALS
ncbi:hypothetical protein SAMN02745784_00995 [Tissierella praeacuta DSM 18095]|uniref:Uncharacterized protein n=1 Tax=Tissierella praeacuta DSM 18095 TaxID=1123404 RepID=A0A1M4UBE3_9FIRM|nr:hypothetical protein [Tissierella praeacuta]TCU77247.1 hypothetical protein EV204_102106 [Tissierella praeacuta]SHE54112.1 hypothetical protein SAMN02745784_00995 [Tissierella praeacuta DSM 18095]SUP04030.1 Uncharacterised protein [Tissierella praeacuta]